MIWDAGTCSALAFDAYAAYLGIFVGSLVFPPITWVIVGSMAYASLFSGMYLYGCQ